MLAGNLSESPAIIAGVVKDFNIHSLYTPIEPAVITTKQEMYRFAALLISGNKHGESRNTIREVRQATYPENVFEYRYLDEQIEDFYHKENLLSNLIITTTVIAILISCLGLLGLMSFFTIQRIKEIGIRKVLGASVQDIVFELSKDFVILVVVSMIITIPIVLYFMNDWLQGFAYRIGMNGWIFALAGLASICITFFIICFQSLKAASENLSKSLKAE